MRALIVLLRLLCHVTGETALTVLIRQVRVVRLICIFLNMLLLCLKLSDLVAHFNSLTPLECADLLDALNRLVEQSVGRWRYGRRLLLFFSNLTVYASSSLRCLLVNFWWSTGDR